MPRWIRAMYMQGRFMPNYSKFDPYSKNKGGRKWLYVALIAGDLAGKIIP